MTVFDANCIYTIKCLALIFVAAPGAMLIGALLIYLFAAQRKAVLQTDFRALEGAKMNILLSILGTAIVTILIAGAYSIGVSVGRAAAEEDNQEPVIYMEHTHGGE